ncbi:hypothetical protein MPSEU_000386800 [Mayamaea pseudoterrestris]|nr:hypothetical protein MPSEU_000386800 [Mayamaea pseudoterrestris]
MQLLDASTTAIPQCVALCFVDKPGLDESDVPAHVSEPLVLSSSLATISSDCVSRALRELVAYASASLIAAMTMEKSFAAELLEEETANQSTMVQTFRPQSAQGMALHYRFIKDDNLLKTLSAHLLAANKAGGSSLNGNQNSVLPVSVSGVLFCVGISGLSIANTSSALRYSLPQRMADCLTIMMKTDPKETTTVKALLSTYLLMDDEPRKSNEMADTPEMLLFQPLKSDDKAASNMGMMSPLAGTLNLRRMAGNNAAGAGNAIGKDTDGGDDNETNARLPGVRLALAPSGADVARVVSEQVKVLAIAESDALLRKYTLSHQERRANLDLAGGSKSRFSRRKNTSRGATRDPDFDNFDYKGPTKAVMTTKTVNTNLKSDPVVLPTVVYPAAKDDNATKAFVPALAAARGDVGSSRRASTSSVQSAGQRSRGSRKGSSAQFVGGDDESLVSGMSDNHSRRRRSSGHEFEDDASNVSDGRSGIATQGRLQVNIALNEDFSCSYKLSQLSTCSVEGVVQVTFIVVDIMGQMVCYP